MIVWILPEAIETYWTMAPFPTYPSFPSKSVVCRREMLSLRSGSSTFNDTVGYTGLQCLC